MCDSYKLEKKTPPASYLPLTEEVSLERLRKIRDKHDRKRNATLNWWICGVHLTKHFFEYMRTRHGCPDFEDLNLIAIDYDPSN